MTTIILEQPLATLIVYGKIKDVPEDIKGNLLAKENVLVAAGLKSYKNNLELQNILNRYNITNTEDLPDLRFLPEVRFLGFARVEDGKFQYVEPMPKPVILPSYVHVLDKVINYEVCDYKITQFLEDIKYIQEEDLQQLLKQRERLVAKNQQQLQVIDKKISEKEQKISVINEKDNPNQNTTISQVNVNEEQDEKPKMKWWHIVILAIVFGLLCWFIDKISFAILVIIFLVGQVFIWMTGGKGGLKL